MNPIQWFAIPILSGMSFWAVSCQSPQPTGPARALAAPAAPGVTEPAPGNAFSGTVVRVDMKARLLTVRSRLGRKQFTVGPKTKVFTETSSQGRLSTLNVGDLVVVDYEQQGALATATRIVRKAVAAGERPAPEVERLEKMLNPDPNNPYKME